MNYNNPKPDLLRVLSQIVCVRRVTAPHMLHAPPPGNVSVSPNHVTIVTAPVDTNRACYNRRDGQTASRSASVYDLSAVVQGYQWGAGAGMRQRAGREVRKERLTGHSPCLPLHCGVV